MPKFFARRRGHTLVPISKASALEMERIPEGVEVRVEAVRQRNGKHHRMIWALFSYTASALNDGPTPQAWTAEDVAEHLKIATGRVEEIRLTGAMAKRYGPVAFRPASISYSAMDETEFSAFADAAVDYIRTQLCPWIEASEHWPQVQEIIAAYRKDEAA